MKGMNKQFDQWIKSISQRLIRHGASKRIGAGLAGIALACLGVANKAQAAEPTYTTIDYPDSVLTLAAGINSCGDIVGRYLDAAGMDHGFVLSGGAFTSMDIPGAELTRPVGINDHGDIVGHFN